MREGGSKSLSLSLCLSKDPKNVRVGIGEWESE